MKARLRAIERQVIVRDRPRELKVCFVFASAFVPRVNRKPLLKKGKHESDFFAVHIKGQVPRGSAIAEARPGTCPPPGNGEGEVTAALLAEIKNLELRKAELQMATRTKARR